MNRSLILAICCAPLLWAQESSPEQPPFGPVDELKHYPNLILEDTGEVLTSPGRWQTEAWVLAGGGMMVILGTAMVLDRPVWGFAQTHRNPAADHFAQNVQKFGAEYSFVVMGGFWAYGKASGDVEAVRTGLDAFAASLISSGVIATTTKLYVGRARPNEGEGPFHFVSLGGDESFPSGHTCQAFTLASVISEHYPQLWVQVVSYGTASLVGLSRIEQNAHWASDVLAGALLGTVVGRTVVRFNQRKRKNAAGAHVEISPWVGGHGGGLILSARF